jgi:hypothetical protein
MTRQDFIDLKWRITKDREYEFDAQYLERQDEGTFWDLTYDLEENTLTIENFYQVKLAAIMPYKTNPLLYNSTTVFQGEIENKEELKTLMKWLGINNQ